MTEEDYKLLGEFLNNAGVGYIENGRVKWTITSVRRRDLARQESTASLFVKNYFHF